MQCNGRFFAIEEFRALHRFQSKPCLPPAAELMFDAAISPRPISVSMPIDKFGIRAGVQC
jgi:hypothetical protein